LDENKTLSKSLLKRLIFLDNELKSETYPNKKELSKKYQISEKTIQRDIEFLINQYEAPIEYDYKRRGYHYFREFSLNPLKLDEGDFFMLAITEKVLRQYRNSPFRNHIEKFYEKIKTLFNDEISIYNDELNGVMSFDIGPMREVNKEYFDKLEKAIREKLIVEIKYHTLHNDSYTTRKINPYHLKNYKGDWYVIAYCHNKNDIRVFALSRITSLKLKDYNFKTIEDIKIDEIMKSSFGIYLDSKEWKVKIKFSAYQARWIKEKKWHTSQEIKENKDGSIILSMTINNLEEIKRWIMQYGKEAEVISPKSLREEMKKEYREGLKKYK